MALLTRRTAAEAAEIEVPQREADPAWAAANALLTALRDRFERLKLEKLRLDLERRFADRAETDDRDNDRALRVRLAALRALPPLPSDVQISQGDRPTTIARGIEVLNGATIEAPRNHQAAHQDLDRQIEVLQAAISAQTEIVERAAAEFTYRAATQLKPSWDALQLALYRDAQQLARTTRRVKDLRAAITAAGIGSRSDVLSMPNVRAPLILGDETNWDSEISGWRRILENMGIL